MWPHATLRLDALKEGGDGHTLREVAVGHGDLIGRMSGAVVYVDDARISEAHAMVSLRAGQLQLLALRRQFFVAGELRSEVTLAPGLRVELVTGLGFVVEQVFLAEFVLGLRIGDRPAIPLLGVCSIVAGEEHSLVSGSRPGALAYLFNRDEDWRLQLAGQAAQDVRPGDSFVVGGLDYELVRMPSQSAGSSRTAPARGGNPGALSLHCEPTTTRVVGDQAGRELTLKGISARIMYELAACGGPVNWYELAQTLWTDRLSESALRGRWDVNVSRLRAKLRAAGVRTNLVRTDGYGAAELFLLPADRLHCAQRERVQ